MDKRRIVELLLNRLQAEWESVTQAAQAAHEAATHQEAKAENQYDTRGLEASYLAGAQAQRAAEMSAQMSAIRMMELQDLESQDPIGLGALVELELIPDSDSSVLRRTSGARRKSIYLIVPQGGGISISWESQTILTLASTSPLGEALMGHRSGDLVEVETQESVREYRIVSAR